MMIDLEWYFKKILYLILLFDLCQLKKFQNPYGNLLWADKEKNNKYILLDKVGEDK